jgi:K+-transporting ATPase ATPase C chain
MITQLIISIRALAVFTILAGFLYPLAITGLSALFFPHQSRGSLVVADGATVGSELIAQKFSADRYFHARPSATDFSAVPSGASNQGFTSRKLLDAVRERQAQLGAGAPADLVYASGSGLDPHISPEAAAFQLARVAAARKLTPERVRTLVERLTEPPQFGIFGQPRVNVLRLNLALDGAGS